MQEGEALLEAIIYHDDYDSVKALSEEYIIKIKTCGLPIENLIPGINNLINTISLFLDMDSSHLTKISSLQDVENNINLLLAHMNKAPIYYRDITTKKAIRMIKNRFREDITLEQIAAELFISDSYLSRILKNETGHGFNHWLNHYRIREAKKLLMCSDMGIEKIAESVGYNSYRIFSKNFRACTGITASEFRKYK